MSFTIFLGLEAVYVNDGLLVSREGYAKKIVERFDMNASKKCSTPLDTNIKIR